MRRTGIILQNNKDPSKGRYFAWLTSERVQNKTCDAIKNEKLYLEYKHGVFSLGRGDN